MTADQDNGLHEFKLSRAEWVVIKDLHDILQVLKDVTLYFSCLTPSLTTVIPAMDHIDQVLATAALDDIKFSAPICAVLTISKDTLNVYYNKTDQSKLYQIAMVLHSCQKLTYFRDAQWPLAWINEAEELVKTEFEKKYKDRVLDVTEEDTLAVDTKGKGAEQVCGILSYSFRHADLVKWTFFRP
ncbi:uncharacterized protein EV420DRAFT_1270382 [Desarmillaria tabescens]|uniref:Uncharacterized protein n=1 Tax=Armillaria tabescens TaxID=1929756 RepID=A0AA39N621_ARMTA|nr:uncharacterized protein EV420DRAFT_1270382 [Desarmillaria tabescens]KAK0458630.1 hypothetical protein EV420DRAFT_1270382 [Desarmillaria tabescens]